MTTPGFDGGEVVRAKKMSHSAQCIVNQLEAQLSFQTYPKGTRFLIGSSLNNETIHIIKSGVLTIGRQPEDFLYRVMEGPVLRTIVPDPEDDFDYILKVIEEAEIAIISSDDFHSLLTEHDLWLHYAKHLHSVINAAADALHDFNQSTSYGIIKKQLHFLNNELDSVKKSITAERYIRNKTPLSRSLIMDILSKLKEGGYINIEKGILLSINKLPEKF